ncbi:MAG: helix-turn-helix domain-containing protein [Gaiellales bacterium]
MVLTIAQAAARSGRGAETVRRWVRAGRLPAHRSGGRLLVHPEDLDALIARPALDPPAGWSRTSWDVRQPDWVSALRRHRGARRIGA